MNRTHEPTMLAAVGDAFRERIIIDFPGNI